MKQHIDKYISELDVGVLFHDHTIENVCDILKEYYTIYPGYDFFKFDYTPADYEDSATLILIGCREETNHEYELRLQQEDRYRHRLLAEEKRNEEKERAEYLRLKAKFEN